MATDMFEDADEEGMSWMATAAEEHYCLPVMDVLITETSSVNGY